MVNLSNKTEFDLNFYRQQVIAPGNREDDPNRVFSVSRAVATEMLKSDAIKLTGIIPIPEPIPEPIEG